MQVIDLREQTCAFASLWYALTRGFGFQLMEVRDEEVACSPKTGSVAKDSLPRSVFVGKWTNRNQAKGGATLNITSVDSTIGQLKGKYIPPSGPAGGKEFDVIGWVSSAPPLDKADNVIVISFSVSLTTYGSIANWTGYLRDNKIIASWHNVRPNSGYEWDHITTGEDTWTKNP